MVHGHQGNQSYTFTENNFIGELDTDSGQRHVSVFNGQSDLSGYSLWGNNFNSNLDEVPIDFENNYWGTTDEDDIEPMISDSYDDFEVIGLIDYVPLSSSASTSAPIQTPSGLIKALSGSDVILTWDAVTASDLKGYKIYSKDEYLYFGSRCKDKLLHLIQYWR